MVAFIDAHRGEYGVEPICGELPIVQSTYYESKARQTDPRRRPARARCVCALPPEIARVRMIVGWRVSRSVKTDLVLDALEQVLHARRKTDGLVHHSDYVATTN